MTDKRLKQLKQDLDQVLTKYGLKVDCLDSGVGSEVVAIFTESGSWFDIADDRADLWDEYCCRDSFYE